jgi:hypothetical protein
MSNVIGINALKPEFEYITQDNGDGRKIVGVQGVNRSRIRIDGECVIANGTLTKEELFSFIGSTTLYGQLVEFMNQ